MVPSRILYSAALTAPMGQNLQCTNRAARGPTSLLVNPILSSDIIWPFTLTFFRAFNWGYRKQVQKVCTEVHLEKHFPSPPGKWWLVYATHFWKHFLELESCLPDCYAGCQNRASFSPECTICNPKSTFPNLISPMQDLEMISGKYTNETLFSREQPSRNNLTGLIFISLMHI